MIKEHKWGVWMIKEHKCDERYLLNSPVTFSNSEHYYWSHDIIIDAMGHWVIFNDEYSNTRIKFCPYCGKSLEENND